jgi:hypothetical protein
MTFTLPDPSPDIYLSGSIFAHGHSISHAGTIRWTTNETGHSHGVDIYTYTSGETSGGSAALTSDQIDDINAFSGGIIHCRLGPVDGAYNVDDLELTLLTGPDPGGGGGGTDPGDPGTIGEDDGRDTVCQGVQLGIQGSCSTVVAAVARLASIDVNMKPVIPRPLRDPCGQEGGSEVGLMAGYSGGTVTGWLSYTDMAIYLASILCVPTMTAPSAGTQKFTYFPSSTRVNRFRRFTIQRGTDDAVSRARCVVFNQLEFTIDENECRLNGTALGATLTDNILGYAATMEIPDRPISPDEVTVLIGDDLGAMEAIGTISELTFSLSDRHVAQWTAVPTEDSITDFLAHTGARSISIRTALNGRAFDMLTTMKAGGLAYLQLLAEGDEIDTGVNEELTMTWACRFVDNDRADNDDEYDASFQLVPIHDDTLGSWVKAELTTSLPGTLPTELTA